MIDYHIVDINEMAGGCEADFITKAIGEYQPECRALGAVKDWQTVADNALCGGHQSEVVGGNRREDNHQHIKPVHAVVTLIDVVMAMRLVHG